jgi:small subunit ribosomal protein S16
MVRIRLRRVGARNQPSYRIVVADQRKPRDGRFLEILGHYNPRTEPATVKVDEARLFHWLKNGAQASDSVQQLLRTFGTWDRWERYKGGEDLEALLEEAGSAVFEVDPRTRRDDLAGKRPKQAPEAALEAEQSAREVPAEAEAAAASSESEGEEKPSVDAEVEVRKEEAPEATSEPEAETQSGEEPEAEAPAEEPEAESEPAAEAESEAEPGEDEEQPAAEAGEPDSEEAD